MADERDSNSAQTSTIGAADQTAISVSQRWAYRKGARDPIECVEVLRIGTARPPRVRIRFVADEHEGREDWVPPGRLKVRWEHVDGWRKAEEAWTALQDVSADAYETPEWGAAEWIFEILDKPYAEPIWRDHGILLVTDVDGLIDDVGIDQATITEDPVAVTSENGDVAVPWRVMEQVAMMLAIKHANQLLAALEAFEREAQHHNRWGDLTGSVFISAETCAEVDQKHGQWRNQVRAWCGTEALDRQQELEALRDEVHRLGDLLERAITSLENAGATTAARQLERDLGVPVEVLRRSADARQRYSGP